MEKISFQIAGEEPVSFYVLEQTTLGGVNYLLVTEEEEGDCEALILKEIAVSDDGDLTYEIVEDEDQLDAIAAVFESILDDVKIDG